MVVAQHLSIVLFVTDARGTNLAIAFGDPQEKFSQSPVGRNFSFRSYFNGQREDGLESSKQTFRSDNAIRICQVLFAALQRENGRLLSVHPFGRKLADDEV